MMRVIFVLILFLLVNCNQVKEKSDFFETCDESVIDLSEGLTITDSLGYFSYQIPDSSWNPLRQLDENGNGLTIGKINNDSLQLFHVLQTNYTYEWNWEEEIKNVEKEFDIVSKGFINLNKKKRPYHLVIQGNDNKWRTLYVTVLDTIQKRNYTLSISTYFSADYNKRICELKPIMESFKIL